MTNNKLQINWDKYTDFQQRVYREIMKIPKGQVWTYGQVARKIGQPLAARAVGNALGRNQDAPFIPCHRVVAQNNFGGYSARGGLKKKLKLLKQEGFKYVS
jgi:methylated-DNA-[protein]-cysteine S-methyltransferase